MSDSQRKCHRLYIVPRIAQQESRSELLIELDRLRERSQELLKEHQRVIDRYNQIRERIALTTQSQESKS